MKLQVFFIILIFLAATAACFMTITVAGLHFIFSPASCAEPFSAFFVFGFFLIPIAVISVLVGLLIGSGVWVFLSLPSCGTN